MGVDFTGGGFEELARETEKLRADAARLRKVEQEAASSIQTDETARRRLAERARQATTRSIAEAETIITRGAQSARVGGEASVSQLAASRRSMDALASSSQRALKPIEQLRAWGPYAFGRSSRAADELAMSMTRIQRTGMLAFSGRGAPAVGPAQQALNQRVGYGAVPPVGAAPTYDAAKVNAYSSSVNRAATSHAVLNAQMQRHGALSSEFLQQLARGNVGLREFGNNLVVTAGKFGGWLAAGAGIFAILGTIGQIGHGAIAAASGVNQLERVVSNVNPDALQAQLGGLSEKFNVPIDVVSEAAYQMGKVFHDQEGAIKGAQSVLYAYKVGELDVATASRYLTAIVNGFNLTADQQSQVFDQLNQAQNKYNISIESVMAGTSKAAGAFHLAGGDVTHLIGLITTLSKATGQTGDVIGTAIQRSPHFIAMDQNKAVLQQYNIDPTDTITHIYAEAQKVAQHLAPDQQRKLAEAMFGPQYGARVGVAFLQQQDLYRQVLGDVSKGASQGSAERELKTTLGSAQEQLARIGVELGALGANLARSGFFDLLLLGVKALNSMLSLVNDILGVFNSLPQPLRHVLSIMTELYVLFRLLRRFNVGSTLPGAAGQAFTNPRNALNDQRESLIVRQSELSNQLVSSSNAVTQAETERTVAQEKVRALTGQQVSAIRDGTANVQGMAKAAAEGVDARKVIANADQKVFDARLKEAVVAREERDVARQIAETRKRGVSVTGIPFVTPPPGVGSATGIDTSEINRTLTGASAQLRRNMEKYGIVGGTIASGVNEVRTGASRLASQVRSVNWSGAISSVRSGAGRLLTSAKGMAAMASPLDLAFAAVATFAVGWQELGSSIASSQQVINTSPQSFADAQQQLEQATSALGASPSSVYIPGKYEEALKAQSDAAEAAQARVTAAQNFQIAIDRMTTGAPLAPEERAAYKAGTYQDVYEKMAEDIRKEIYRHQLNMKTGQEMLDRLVKRARTDPHIEDPQGLIQSLRDTSFGRAAQQNADTITKQAQIDAARGPLYDPVGEAKKALDAAKKARDVLNKQGASGTDILDAQLQVAQADRDYRTALDDRAKSILDAHNALQQSQIDPNRTVARAKAALDAAHSDLELAKKQDRSPDEIRQAQAAVNDAEFAAQQAVRERMLAMIDISERVSEANAPLYAPLASVRSKLAAARQKLDVTKSHGGTPQEIKDAAAAVDEAQREFALAVDERAQSLLEARGALALSNIDPNDAVARAAQEAQNARNALAQAQRQGRSRADIIQAIAAVGNAEASLQQAVEERARNILDLQGQIAITRINPEKTVAVARASLNNARAAYQLVVAQGGTQEQVLQAYLAMRQAESSLNQAIQQRAEAIALARLDIQAAQAEAQGNEVRQAAISAREALYQLRHADTGEERLTARAALIRARGSRREAIFQSEVDDIQFQADIGKLTLEQQIRAYDHLLHTMNLTKDMRRDLRRRIAQLKNDIEQQSGDFELKVGDIRLPTAYEIKRAIGAGTATNSTSVVVNQQNSFSVSGDNATEAVQTMQRQMSTAGDKTRNALRSAGLV